MTSSGPCAIRALPISSLPPDCYVEQHDPEIIALQRKTHLPRIPRATDAYPNPLTLEQLLEWIRLWTKIHRPSTQSERDDHSECERQIYAASESDDDFVVYDSEEERRQARREARQRPLSPPSTPPHLKGPKLYKNRDVGLAPQTGSSKVKKAAKSKSRVAPRRPCTRSRAAPAISLHHRKGQLVYWRLPGQYTVMGFDEYLRAVDRE